MERKGRDSGVGRVEMEREREIDREGKRKGSMRERKNIKR